MEDYRIKVFMAVCSAGSFTKAAERLGITQPAVSQNIAELEKYIGTSVFSRSGGKVSLTPQGEIFRRSAEKIEKTCNDMDNLFMRGCPHTGEYRVYFSPVARECIKDRVMEYVRTLFPELTIILTEKMEDAEISVISAPSKHPGELSFRFTALPKVHPVAKMFDAVISEILESDCPTVI